MIYRLKPIGNSVEVPDLSLLQFADFLGDNDYSLILRQPGTNESLSAHWKTVKCDLAPEYIEGKEIPDVSYWGSYLFMTQHAYDVFNGPLKREGEFLPLTVAGQPMYIYIPLTFGQEDTTRTVKHFEDGYECGLEQLVFVDDDVANKWVFKSKLYGYHALFATDTFKRRFEDARFTGLEFDTDLAGVF